MESIVEASWRIYPAAILVGTGVVVGLLGAKRIARFGRTPNGDREKPTVYASGLRLFFIGFALPGLAAGWITHQPVLLAIAFGIGGAEILETSVVLWTLRSRERSFVREGCRRPPGR